MNSGTSEQAQLQAREQALFGHKAGKRPKGRLERAGAKIIVLTVRLVSLYGFKCYTDVRLNLCRIVVGFSA